MSFFDKMKNLFTDEVEDDSIKSEVIQVEIPSPASEAELNNEVKEEKVSTPIFFDDEYFKELDQPKPEIKVNHLKEKVSKPENKQFKPTPIISPIYGVLDKNYNKEDITTKQSVKQAPANNLDEVRKRAFGTLEDDLEDTLFGPKSILFTDEVEKENDSTDLFDELIEIDEEPKEKIEESELLDLIDSMYEKGE